MPEGNLIVNYLPHHFYEDDLRRLFSTVARPTYVKIMKNNMGVSKGFGFVNFATKEEAEMCLKIFNQFQITERKKLKVSWSRPGYRIGCNLHVKHIPRLWNENDVLKLFKPFGEIIDVRVLRFPNSIFNKEAGFVRFNDPQAAREAMQSLNGYRPPDFPECAIQIEIAHKDLKKIESRYGRRHYRKNHYKAQSNNLIALLMNLLGERKSIEQKLSDELMRLEQSGLQQGHSKEYVRLNVAWEHINQELHSQLQILHQSDPASAEMVARVDDTCATWMYHFMSEGQSNPHAMSAGSDPSFVDNMRFDRAQSFHNPQRPSPHHNGSDFDEHAAAIPASVPQKEEWPSVSKNRANGKETDSAGSSHSTAGFAKKSYHTEISNVDNSKPAKAPFSVGRCVFFSNFPPQFPEQVITSTFEAYSKVIKLKLEHDNNGQSLGMGCAMFETATQARRVCESLNETEFLDRKISLLMMPENTDSWD